MEESNKKANVNGSTWGGEYIIDLNFDGKKLNEWNYDDSGPDGEDDSNTAEILRKLHGKNRENLKTDTVKYLFNLGQRTMKQIQDDAQRFIVKRNENGGYQIFTKKYDENERRPLSDEEIKELVAHKRGEDKEYDPTPPAKFSFDDNGNLLKDGKRIPGNRKKKFIQQLHKAAEIIYGPGKVHYRWEQLNEEGADWTDRLLVNTSGWDSADELDPHRFDAAEYKLVDTDEEKEKLLGIISSIVGKAKKRKTIDLGFDWDKREFTINGHPMSKEELSAFVRGLNGGVSSEDDEEYWNHFKISIKGSKVGDIANFSLPPVQTCNKAAPCISDGCYAVKAYGLYPGTRAAQDINLRLLKDGKYDQFVKEISTAIGKTFKKTVGAMKKGEKIQYFRFHVSGDVFSDDYFNAMCEVARKNPNIGFWTYTKQYDILLRNMKKIPDNMSVLVSCWGEFRPKMLGKKYEILEKEFPLAYLDDGSEETRNYIDTKDGKGEPFVCPCTDYSEAEVHCNKCLKCYKVGEIMNTNLVFKKH